MMWGENITLQDSLLRAQQCMQSVFGTPSGGQTPPKNVDGKTSTDPDTPRSSGGQTPDFGSSRSSGQTQTRGNAQRRPVARPRSSSRSNKMPRTLDGGEWIVEGSVKVWWQCLVAMLDGPMGLCEDCEGVAPVCWNQNTSLPPNQPPNQVFPT